MGPAQSRPDRRRQQRAFRLPPSAAGDDAGGGSPLDALHSDFNQLSQSVPALHRSPQDARSKYSRSYRKQSAKKLSSLDIGFGRWLVSQQTFRTLPPTGQNHCAEHLAFREPGLQLLEGDQLARDRARGNGRRAGEPELARAAPTREVPIDGAHRDLLGAGRGARAAIRTGAAGRLQDGRADPGKGVEVAPCLAVVANGGRAELPAQVLIR